LHAAAEVPYLTVVATSRNDDHGVGMIRRMQTFVNALVAQCDRHRLPTELLLVEWNPPGDRPPLVEALEWPASDGYCSVRIVQVPNEIHNRFEHADRLPLFQMIAKNVGIRRAAGPFVLATNVDLVFSDELMRFLARRKLAPSRVYRVDRLDISDGIDPAWPIQEQLRYCRANVIRVNQRDGTLDKRTGDFYRIYHRQSRLLERARLIAAERMPTRAWLDHAWLDHALTATGTGIVVGYRIARKSVRKGVRKAYATGYWFVCGFNRPREVPRRVKNRLLRRHPSRTAVSVPPSTEPMSAAQPPTASAVAVEAPPLKLSPRQLLAARLRAEWIAERARIRLHTNASGDFTLMSKQAWLESGGYAELEMYSMHIDGLQLYQAHYVGILESFLPYPVYHIEHDSGHKPETAGPDSLADSLARKAIPQVTHEQLVGWFSEMYSTKKPIDFNREDWGLTGESLPEHTIALARRDREGTR
jgi:hypothetical protein